MQYHKIAWWAVTWRTTQTTETAKIGGRALARVWALAQDFTVFSILGFNLSIQEELGASLECNFCYLQLYMLMDPPMMSGKGSSLMKSTLVSKIYPSFYM